MTAVIIRPLVGTPTRNRAVAPSRWTGNDPGVSRPKRTKDDRANPQVVPDRLRLWRTPRSRVWSL